MIPEEFFEPRPLPEGLKDTAPKKQGGPKRMTSTPTELAENVRPETLDDISSILQVGRAHEARSRTSYMLTV